MSSPSRLTVAANDVPNPLIVSDEEDMIDVDELQYEAKEVQKKLEAQLAMVKLQNKEIARRKKDHEDWKCKEEEQLKAEHKCKEEECKAKKIADVKAAVDVAEVKQLVDKKVVDAEAQKREDSQDQVLQLSLIGCLF